jgi:hypothetical protein
VHRFRSLSGVRGPLQNFNSRVIRARAVAQISPEKMLLVSCDSHKPSGVSKKDTPDGFSELDCKAVWGTACQVGTKRVDRTFTMRFSLLSYHHTEQADIPFSYENDFKYWHYPSSKLPEQYQGTKHANKA